MGQLALAFDLPAPTPGTWVCGICHCERPDDQLWCSCLADHTQRDRLHQLLADCDNPICVPALPCPTCSDAINEERIPWAPAYRCLGCRRLPGEAHAEHCDDFGDLVPPIADQLAQLHAIEGPIVCRVPIEEERRALAEEFPEFVAPMPEGVAAMLACPAVCSCGQRCTEQMNDHQGRPHGHGMHFWTDEDKARRAAPSTRTAESVECPSCHSLPGDRCRNYRGKGCAPHRQRIEAAKDDR